MERWLKAPLQREDGSLVERDRGTPQGSAISPLLANMFLHYAFDAWMARKFPAVRFERYCDDIIVHARSEPRPACCGTRSLRGWRSAGLELNEQKTRIVYCKDDDRRGSYEHTSFDFLGVHVPPAAVEEQVREALPELHSGGLGRGEEADAARDAPLALLAVDKTLTDLARMFNPELQGWINYYGRFYKSMLHPVFRHLNETS